MSIILVSLLLRNIFSAFLFYFLFNSFFKVVLWAKVLFYQSETTNVKQFFQNFNFCFLFLVQYCLETCVNRIANCVTQKFTPLRSKFYKLFFSMSFYGQFRQLFHISESTLSKQFFLNCSRLVFSKLF